MNTCKIHQATAFEDSPVTVMNRVQNASGANITQASLTAVTYRVWQYESKEGALNDAGTKQEIGSSGTVTIADSVFDALQTAAPWDSTIDATGYNFKVTLPAARLPAGNKWYRVEFWFDPTSGEDFPVVWVVYTKPLARS